jgi:uridylate kinase
MGEIRYNRVLLKLSGESLGGGARSIDTSAMDFITGELAGVASLGVQTAIVIGGGNFLRGRDLADQPAIQRVTADYMGMLATVMNALALRDALLARGVRATVLSAIADNRICEPYSARLACDRLSRGETVILAGGTGSPYFTTDTCAALRASEIGAQVLLKATTVDGVYDSDPRKNPAAMKYDALSYSKVLADRLGVMDLTAISLCMENKLPVMVFALASKGNLEAAVRGRKVGTIIGEAAKE